MSAFGWVRRWLRRWQVLRRPEPVERELDAEMRLHIDLEAEELQRTQGLSPAEARRQALIAFGGVDRFKEAHRDARRVRLFEEFWQDLRYAVRGLVRSPAFSLSAMLVLALGIGAATAAFSAVDAVLLTRLPYPRDDRLVRIYLQSSPTSLYNPSVVDFRAMEEEARGIATIGLLRPRTVPVSSAAGPTRTQLGWVTSGIFRALEPRLERGRGIEPRDDSVGADRVVVLGDRFARRNFGAADPLGQSVTIDGNPHTVVGVLPTGVQDLAGIRAQLWPALQLQPPTRRGPFGQFVIARLADDVTLDDASRDLAGLSRRIFPIWAASYQDSTARLVPVALRQAIIGNSGRALGVFTAAALLVLLVAITNVASLMLVRSAGRWREVALRSVLGATRGRLVRLLVTESVVLAGAGALLGLAFSTAALRLTIGLGGGLPRLDQARLDSAAAAVAAGLALLTGIVVGAYPVSLLLSREPAPALRSGDRTAGTGRRTQAVRGAFVAVQFALTLPLLAGAGVLVRAVVQLQRADPGFDPERALAIHVSLPSAIYSSDSAIVGYWNRALPLVRQNPGVQAAGLGTAMPPDDAYDWNNFDLIDRPVAPGSPQHVTPWSLATAEYFDALGIPLLDGRRFQAMDTAGGPPVVLVSRSWADRFYPGEQAIGRQLISGGCTTCPPTTIIGVVGDVKYEGLGRGSEAVYDPLTQGWQRDVNLFVRTAGTPAEMVTPVRAVLQSLDPQVALEEIGPMSERVYASTATPRQWARLLGGYGAVALTLAAVGIFGMLAYSVTARRREVGVRLALGANPSAVVRMIVVRGMSYAVVGAGIGLVAALVGTRWLAGALVQGSETEPLTLVGVTLLLLGVAGIACWLPARKASAIDPVEAIRAE